MMNKKGFTLVELLVVIAIIAVITTSISVAMVNMLDSQKESAIEDAEENIEAAACTYAEVYSLRDKCSDKNDCEITITIEDNLIPNGYLDDTGDYTSGNVVIKWDETGLKTCTYGG